MPRIIAILSLSALALFAVACGSDDGVAGPPTATSTPAATREPTPTLAPGQATPTPEPVTSNRPVPQPGDPAPDFTLPSANSEQVTLSELAAEQPVVLVFYRAFW